jgi:hypothetical protein
MGETHERLSFFFAHGVCTSSLLKLVFTEFAHPWLNFVVQDKAGS